jgi:hypothetical protein
VQRKLQNSLRNKTKEEEGREWGGENGWGFYKTFSFRS